jgi:hypothetical protein
LFIILVLRKRGESGRKSEKSRERKRGREKGGEKRREKEKEREKRYKGETSFFLVPALIKFGSFLSVAACAR